MNCVINCALAAVLMLATVTGAGAQSTAPLLYRVFLVDGTTLASFGEWARVDDRLVFSIPLTPSAPLSDLHLVSVPIQQIDVARTERYAASVRAASYASTRGEADFAQLSSDVAHTLNQVALIADPAERLALAERARNALVDWPSAHHGYRTAEVREIVGVLDGVIAGLRTAVGQSGFDLSLAARTADAPPEPLLESPDQREIVQQLMTASAVVSSPAERVSLLRSVVALIDRAVDLLPQSYAATVRASALGRISEEHRVDSSYARLRSSTLADALRFGQRADVRALERLREHVREQDAKLGARRPEDVAAVLATVDAHLDSAHRLRLAHDQWLLRVDRARAYQRAALPFVRSLIQSEEDLDDIRTLAGPPPQRLRSLAQRLLRGARRLALVQPPSDLDAIHAVFRSAFALAENAVRLRLDAAGAADVELARQASSAASGALMLMARAQADLDAALRSPIARPTTQP
jgi:hypothetical protein